MPRAHLGKEHPRALEGKHLLQHRGGFVPRGVPVEPGESQPQGPRRTWWGPRAPGTHPRREQSSCLGLF